MKTLFSIGSAEQKSSVLLLELGPDLCCYGLLDTSAKAFNLIRYTSFDALEIEESLPDLLDDLIGSQFTKVLVSTAWPKALLCPQSFSGDHKTLIEAVYGHSAQRHLSDAIPEWQMTTAYTLPESVHDVILQHFPDARFLHAYTPALKIYNGFVATDQADVLFSNRHFRVIVKKNGAVQLAQTYAYRTPLDVAYCLLKIFSEFGLQQSEAFVILSGLIEQDSALYEELHQYFLHLHFAQPSGYTLPEDKHPQHFFTSLYNLAACAS